jgi:hypothetical protein
MRRNHPGTTHSEPTVTPPPRPTFLGVFPRPAEPGLPLIRDLRAATFRAISSPELGEDSLVFVGTVVVVTKSR